MRAAALEAKAGLPNGVRRLLSAIAPSGAENLQGRARLRASRPRRHDPGVFCRGLEGAAKLSVRPRRPAPRDEDSVAARDLRQADQSHEVAESGSPDPRPRPRLDLRRRLPAPRRFTAPTSSAASAGSAPDSSPLRLLAYGQSLRRACDRPPPPGRFDHIIVKDEQHAERVLHDYLAYYHGRPDRGLRMQPPDGARHLPPPRPPKGTPIVAIPILGGLHLVAASPRWREPHRAA
jgi:hypothetical protein